MELFEYVRRKIPQNDTRGLDCAKYVGNWLSVLNFTVKWSLNTHKNRIG